MSENLFDRMNREALERYQDALAARLHDDACERRERFYICNCSKRRRVASGLVTVPTVGLYFPPPTCPSCYVELTFSGDGWDCEDCSLTWNSAGDASSARFTDDNDDAVGNTPDDDQERRWGRRLIEVYG